MCGRFVFPDSDTILQAWQGDLACDTLFAASYNAAPTQPVPMLRQVAGRGDVMQQARWGLIPHWWKQSDYPRFSFNARSEDAHHKPMWRDAFQESRCIIPAVGWYEWQAKTLPTAEKKQTVKQPYFLYSSEQPVIWMAGLYAHWVSPDGPVTSCAILTRAAPAPLDSIHDRMPVILSQGDSKAWLDSTSSQEEAQQLVARAQSGFTWHPVSRAVNSGKANDRSLLTPVDG